MIATGLLLFTLAGGAGAQQTTEPQPCAPIVSPDAAGREKVLAHASRALASGKLAVWERAWYQKLVAGTVTPRRVTVWQTQYGLWDPQRYKGDLYHVACNQLPLGTVVWLPSTGRLHVVTNRGAASNDRAARRKGGAYWIDVWTHREGQYGWSTTTGSMYIVGKAPWRH